MTNFYVDENRVELIDGLQNTLNCVQDLRSSRWVSLEAPAGWGKTRIVHELYKRLAEDQILPYWPLSITRPLNLTSDTILQQRKCTFPTPDLFERSPSALPDFMWFGVNCETRGGVPWKTLIDDFSQFDYHGTYLEASWSKKVSLINKELTVRERIKKAGLAVVNELEVETVAHVIDKTLEHTVPHLGLVLNLTKLGISSLYEKYSDQQRIATPGSLRYQDKTKVITDSMIKTISRMAIPGLPLIVFIEDIHKATPDLERFIDSLVRTDAAILIISTSLPGELDKLQILGQTCCDEKLQDKVVRIRHGAQIVSDTFPKGASLQAVSCSIKSEIVRGYYPNVEHETLNKLVARFNNPLALELFCLIPAYRRKFANGKLTLSSEEIESLPYSLESLYLTYWEMLSTPAQQLLGLATITTMDKCMVWDHEVLLRVCGEDDVLKEIQFTGINDTSLDGWSFGIEGYLKQFYEIDLMLVAAKSAKGLFHPDEVESILMTLTMVLNDSNLPIYEHSQRSFYTAQLVLFLRKNGYPITDDLLINAIRQLQEAAFFNFKLEADICDLFLSMDIPLTSPEHHKAAVGLLQSDEFHSKLLQYNQEVNLTLEAYEKILESSTKRFGPKAECTLSIRRDIAIYKAWNSECDRKDLVTDFEAILNEMHHALGSDHSETIRTKMEFISLLFNEGDIHKAIGHFKDLYLVSGWDKKRTDPSNMETRIAMAFWKADSGRVHSAETELENLLFDFLNPEDNDYLEVDIYLLAEYHYWKVSIDDLVESEHFYEDLLPTIDLSDYSHDDVFLGNILVGHAIYLTKVGKKDDSISLSNEVLTPLFKNTSEGVSPFATDMIIGFRLDIASLLQQHGYLADALDWYITTDSLFLYGTPSKQVQIAQNNVSKLNKTLNTNREGKVLRAY
ncbi:hypothetical protein VIBNIFTn2_120142 [Vibrio nigripulchritudo FTn2]|uniref:hypothetical protein n=1 Tax=Vibrio nigripulchritudo TaxID=28173 RepID=UPI0003B22ECF|nr:hypothetical protein [Vibrio nigripulchritudo]CCN40160.1 hypothetical protein VIBNIFTn2_120142 [Vibrio nigripulchritudo FTn2]